MGESNSKRELDINTLSTRMTESVCDGKKID